MGDGAQHSESLATPQVVRSYLETETFQKALRETVAEGLNPERLARLTIQVVGRSADLQKCSILSIADCVLQAAELGLEVSNSVLGHAFLVPFKGEAKLIVSYKGKAELARRSGLVARIEARAYHANDEVRPIAGTKPRLVHKWDAFKDRGPVVGYYAVAFFKDGGSQFDLMTDADVERIRARAPSGNSPAWKEHRAEMGKKTVAHRLEKQLPLSPVQQKAHDLDEEEGDIVQGKLVSVSPIVPPAVVEGALDPKPKRSKALAAAQEKAQQIELPKQPEKVPAGIRDAITGICDACGTRDGHKDSCPNFVALPEKK